ncbi:Mannosyltransferase (PIG-V) [Phytophthora infestans]|uniref:GPI mannosyltransferase 2 n=1 Tax=Phytophthora infestans TaxID=4787 RepID=A0A833T1C7_PHYIN|nr:Mannosyltransferase (PIG-V) [Phytophthora infestans]
MQSRIVVFAAATRACVTLLALSTSAIVVPYDTSSHLQAGGSPFAPLSNWDGVYYSHIALHGYDFEHFHAFFPLYPLLARLLAGLMPLETSSAVMVSGWLVSNASFVLAALFLYRLGCVVLRDELVARRAAYLFCVAPSSIFMSAIYSESLMCLLSFSGMYFLAKHAQQPKTSQSFLDLVLCALLFGAASATRSNGALLSLFIAWYRVTVSPSPREFFRFLGFWIRTAVLGILAIGPQIVYFVTSMVPYCPSLVQRFGWEVFGTGEREDRSWCENAVPNLTAMYSFIQSKYWNVGLFRYYEWKQLPNFILAAPIFLLSFHALDGYFRRSVVPGQSIVVSEPQGRGWRGTALTPYYVHWLFLVVNALLVVHIQVTTRFLCACPPLFWHPAMLMCGSKVKSKAPPVLTSYGRLVVSYFLLFTVLGSVLFPSFYPWT